MNNDYMCWSCGDLGKFGKSCKSACEECKWKCRIDNDGRYSATIRDKILGIGCNCSHQSLTISVPNIGIVKRGQEQEQDQLFQRHEQGQLFQGQAQADDQDQSQVQEQGKNQEQIQLIALKLEKKYAAMKKVASKDRISRIRMHGLSPRGLSQSLPDEVTS